MFIISMAKHQLWMMMLRNYGKICLSMHASGLRQSIPNTLGRHINIIPVM